MVASSTGFTEPNSLYQLRQIRKFEIMTRGTIRKYHSCRIELLTHSFQASVASSNITAKLSNEFGNNGRPLRYKLRQIKNYSVEAPRPPHTPTTLAWTTKHLNLGLTLPSQPSIHAETKFRHCHLRMQLKKPPTARTSRCYNSGTIWTTSPRYLNLSTVRARLILRNKKPRRVIQISAAFKSASIK